jgi:hypothetical protein
MATTEGDQTLSEGSRQFTHRKQKRFAGSSAGPVYQHRHSNLPDTPAGEALTADSISMRKVVEVRRLPFDESEASVRSRRPFTPPNARGTAVSRGLDTLRYRATEDNTQRISASVSLKADGPPSSASSGASSPLSGRSDVFQAATGLRRSARSKAGTPACRSTH